MNPLYSPVWYVCRDEGSEERGLWWMDRGDFAVPRQHTDQSESTETAPSDQTGT